jgi:hypothetical protein
MTTPCNVLPKQSTSLIVKEDGIPDVMMLTKPAFSPTLRAITRQNVKQKYNKKKRVTKKTKNTW